ncbi:MAG: FliH/SctL family protein [Nitrospirota bacterium]|nr:FliH/SctL family protein [Nitrospirota bacterium]
MPSKWSKVIKEPSNGLAIENWEAVDLQAERLAREQAEKDKEPPHDCSQLQQEAFEAGLVQGREEARNPAEVEVQRALSLVAQTEQLRLESARQAEFNIVELALAMAKKVIHRETSLDAGIAVEQVRQLVQSIAEKGLITVRAHPSEMAHLQSFRAFVVCADGEPARLSFEGDESIQPGGCIVESSQYFIDATVETQLDKIWQEMIKPNVEPDIEPDTTPPS